MTVAEFGKQDVVDVLERCGLRELADEAKLVLPDPVDLETLDRFAAPHGLTVDELVSMMGGSP